MSNSSAQYAQRFLAAKDRGARVALALGVAPGLVIAGQVDIDLALLQLGLLQRQDIDVEFLRDLDKARVLFEHGAQAVDVPRDESHGISPVFLPQHNRLSLSFFTSARTPLVPEIRGIVRTPPSRRHGRRTHMTQAILDPRQASAALADLFDTHKRVVFFGGAGVSTASGIPDFRSVDGLYHQQFAYPPETMLSHSFYEAHPAEFFDFYRTKMIALGAKPNRCHTKLAELERAGKLNAVVTQNIDGLHQKAGSREVLELHGSVHRNHCQRCGKFYGLEHILRTEGVSCVRRPHQARRSALRGAARRARADRCRCRHRRGRCPHCGRDLARGVSGGRPYALLYRRYAGHMQPCSHRSGCKCRPADFLRHRGRVCVLARVRGYNRKTKCKATPPPAPQARRRGHFRRMFMANDSKTWRCGKYELSFDRPRIMGVLNVTPDSFSDGGEHFDPDAAIEYGLAMLDAGADIIDVGGESTRPGFNETGVTLEEERRRVIPVVERLVKEGFIVSVDTSKPEIMTEVASLGARILNDIRGFEMPGALEAAAATDCGLVVMHRSATTDYKDVVAEVEAYLQERQRLLEGLGVSADRICWDPGFGFGNHHPAADRRHRRSRHRPRQPAAAHEGILQRHGQGLCQHHGHHHRGRLLCRWSSCGRRD